MFFWVGVHAVQKMNRSMETQRLERSGQIQPNLVGTRMAL